MDSCAPWLGYPSWNFAGASASWLYVGGGIFVEIGRKPRLKTDHEIWESASQLAIGIKSINRIKREEEGRRRTRHIVLGFYIDTELMSICLPEAKRADARVLVGGNIEVGDSHLITVAKMHQIRGHMGHSKTTIFFSEIHVWPSRRFTPISR